MLLDRRSVSAYQTTTTAGRRAPVAYQRGRWTHTPGSAQGAVRRIVTQAPGPVVKISSDHMASMVQRLGRHGEQPGGGLIRPQYSVAWAAARDETAALMEEAGLEVRIDPVGNVFGRLAGDADDGVLLTGSHLDTVYLGGKYDGALGVLAGIAALGALRAGCGAPRRTLEVVGLCEEESSRFHANFFGSRALLGLVSSEEPQTLHDPDRVSLAQAMTEIGLDPAEVSAAHRTDIRAFIELHIEQGRVLESRHVDIGVVTAITAVAWQMLTVEGRADHAGTTHMAARQDAFLGAAEMALAAESAARQLGDPAVATTGFWHVEPGGPNIVPERVEFSLDARHPDPKTLQTLVSMVDSAAADVAARRRLQLRVDTVKMEPAAATDEDLQQVLVAAAEACDASWMRMASGAGHDAQLWAKHVPTAMIFVPSVDGRSHHQAEYTSQEDCARGATVLAQALHALAYR